MVKEDTPEYIIELEKEFDKYRIFNDKRDLEFPHDHNHKGEKLTDDNSCVIFNISPFLNEDYYKKSKDPDQKLLDESHWVCMWCVERLIDVFKKYRKEHNMSESNFNQKFEISFLKNI